MKQFLTTFILLSMLIVSGYAVKPSTTATEKKNTKVVNNVLTAKEKAEGWQLLFDGKSFDLWRGFNGRDASKDWVIEDGALKSLGHVTGSLVSLKDYENFELQLEWRISKGGNSGILYGVIEGPKYKRISDTGPEYQLFDDVGYPGKLEETQMAGANYEMYVADKSQKVLKTVESGEFNSAKIIVNKTHVEQWLNGKKIVEFERWTDDWNKRRLAGKWKDYPDYGLAKKGKISLQDHGTNIWFRNIKIRELK